MAREAAKTITVDAEVGNKFLNQGDYANGEGGFEFVDITEDGLGDHGDIEGQLILRRISDGTLYSGVYTAPSNSKFGGPEFEYAKVQFRRVGRTEKTVVVISYEPI